MGLFDFMKKPRPLVPPRSLAKLKKAEGFDAALLDQPLFGDLVACLAILAHTDVDVSRLGSKGYLKRLVGGRTTVNDRSMKKLMEAVNIDRNRLTENGYINQCVRQMHDTAAIAKKRGESEATVQQCASALNVACLAFARFILDAHPEYAEALPVLAGPVKDLA